MSIEIISKLSLDINYKEIKNKETYENVLLQIMNDSNEIFTDQFEKTQEESHGEPDYYSKTSPKKKYEAKLLFYNEICENMQKEDINKWFVGLQKEINEAHDVAMQLTDLKTSEIYRIVKNRISKISADENGILFFPFPIGLETKDSILKGYLDISLSYIIKQAIKELGLMESNKNYYFVYGNVYNHVVIVNLKNNEVEVLEKDYISRFIKRVDTVIKNR